MADAEKTGKSHDLAESDEEWLKRHRCDKFSSESGSDEEDTTSRSTDTFLNVVALGNVGAGKSAVLNSLIGHPVLPTGNNGGTRGPIITDLSSEMDTTSNLVLARTMRRFLQQRLREKASEKNRDEIYFKLRTSTAPPLKLIELPGLDQDTVDNSVIFKYAQQNDAILLVIVPATQVSEIVSSKALEIAKKYDPKSTRTVGIICKVDQAAENLEAVAAVEALLLRQGPSEITSIQWFALTGLTDPIASAQARSGENSLESVWKAETERLKSIFTGDLQSNLGRIALLDTLGRLIHSRMTHRLPGLVYTGKSDSLEDELERLCGQLAKKAGGTSVIGLCREFEDKLHLAWTGSEVARTRMDVQVADEKDAPDADIFPLDIVKNRNTGALGLVSSNGRDVHSFSQLTSQPLRIDEVMVVERVFNLGQIVTRLRERTEEIGVVVGVTKKSFTLANPNGDSHINVSAEQLQRFREFFQKDYVFKGKKVGIVRTVELVITVVFEDESEVTVVASDENVLKRRFTNKLEEAIGHDFYKGQEVLYMGKTGVVKTHKVNRVEVDWFGDWSELPVWHMTKELCLLLPRQYLSSWWFVGLRCIMNGEEFLITECDTSTVSVLWKGGNEEEVVSTEIAETEVDKFFDGEFQIPKIVRLVKEIPSRPYFGTILGVNDTGIKISWGDGTESTVPAEDIELIVEEEVALDEDDIALDEDYTDNENSDADPNDIANEVSEEDMAEDDDMDEDSGVTTDDEFYD